jgi:guanine deaminase
MAGATGSIRTRALDLVAHVADRVLDDAVRSAATDGGPFAALILDGASGTVVAGGTNRVTATLDPTAHAEVNAIRSAASLTGSVGLDGLILVASCEPCPMCLAAALWARLDAVVFLATRREAAAVGFDDERFHEALGAPDTLPSSIAGMLVAHLAHPRARAPFDAWAANDARIHY